MLNDWVNHEDGSLYMIRNRINPPHDEQNNKMDSWLTQHRVEFEDRLVYGYLDSIIKLFRLYKPGNIALPAMCYCVNEDFTKIYHRTERQRKLLTHPRFSLTVEETQKITSFVKKHESLLNKANLKSSVDAFNRSYQLQFENPDLAFLALITAAENSLSDGYEIGYKTSRNLAVLIGNDFDDSKYIFKRVNVFYKLRSHTAHTMNPISNRGGLVVTSPIIEELRDFIRRAIIKIDDFQLEKGTLLVFLEEKGFGQVASDSSGLEHVV